VTTSPDLTPFVNLTVYDRDPHELVQRALQYLQVYLPEWIPRTGNTEVALLYAMAYVVAEQVYAINRLVTGTLQALLKAGFQIPQDFGAPPTATATLTVQDTLGYTIPAGTVLRLPVGSPTVPTLDFALTANLVIAPGSTTGTASLLATTSTDAANGLAPPVTMQIITRLPYLDGAVLASAPAGGRPPEDGSAYLQRAQITLQRLTAALVLPSQFQAAAAETPGIFRALAINNWDGSGATPGTVPGNLTVAVYGQGGVPISSGNKTALQAALQASADPALTVTVVDPTITTINVNVNVKRYLTSLATDVQAAVDAAIDAYLSTDTWMWGATMPLAELTAVIDRVAGVDDVSSFVTPTGDVALSGGAPLAAAGTVTVTVIN
jgi:hypothetical protein